MVGNMKTKIETKALSKSYKGFQAVADNNISIKKGEIYGFLGLNGAGKTTTIRMLLGLIKASSGTSFIDGVEVSKMKSEMWNKIGYLVEVPHAYPNLTVKENQELIATLRKLDKNTSVERVMQQLDLMQYANRKSKHLSLGNKQRLGLAKALIHQPEILILDEPTNGLDPAGIHDIRELLMDLAQNHGVTILVSSHILGEISAFTHRIGIIHQGRMIKEFETKRLNELCQKHLSISCVDNEKAMRMLEESGFKQLKLVEEEIHIQDKIAIDDPEEMAILALKAGCKLLKLAVEQENLESYFLRTIKEKEV
jgi:ABC-2 type transport system ATP-binding protein